MALMIVKHLIVGWTRRVMASAYTDFLCHLVWRLMMCLLCNTIRGGGKCDLVLVGIDCTMGRYHV